MPGDRLTVAVTAELREFERRLALLPDIGGKEAKELASKVRKELKHAESGATDVGKAMSGSFKKASEVLKKGFESAGGPIASIGKAIFDFALPLGQAAGGVGEVTASLGVAGVAATGVGVAVLGAAAAIGVAAVAGGVLVAGMAAVTNAAGEAVKRLDAMGESALVDPAAREALDQYQHATAALWQQVDVLTTQLGAALAPALTALAGKVTDLIEWVNGLEKSFDAVRRKIDEVIDWLPEWARWAPAINLVKGAVDDLEGAYQTLVDTAAEAKLAPTQAEIDRWTKLAEEREKLRLDDEARQRRELTDAIAAEVAEQERLLALQESVSSSIDQWAWDQRFANYERELEAVDKLNEAIVARRLEEQRTSDAALGAARERMGVAAKEAQYVASAFGEATAAIELLTDGVIASYTARLEAGDAVTAAEVARAQRALALQKTLELVSLTASAIATWFNLTRDLSTIPGNAIGAPFEAAAIVLGSMVVPASQILGESIPFPRSSGGGGAGSAGSAVTAPNGYEPPPDQGANYKDDGGGYRGGQSGASSSRSSGGGESVTVVAVTFTNGRIGKRRI